MSKKRNVSTGPFSALNSLSLEAKRFPSAHKSKRSTSSNAPAAQDMPTAAPIAPESSPLLIVVPPYTSITFGSAGPATEHERISHAHAQERGFSISIFEGSPSKLVTENSPEQPFHQQARRSTLKVPSSRIVADHQTITLAFAIDALAEANSKFRHGTNNSPNVLAIAEYLATLAASAISTGVAKGQSTESVRKLLRKAANLKMCLADPATDAVGPDVSEEQSAEAIEDRVEESMRFKSNWLRQNA